MSEELFNVWQFLDGDIQEEVRHGVSAKEAVEAAHFYTHNMASKLGITLRVIITDGGDCTCFEWKKGEGVTYPVTNKSVNWST